MTQVTAWAIKAQNVCVYLILFDLTILSLMYGISGIYTNNWIQVLLSLFLWTVAGKILLWSTDRDRCVRVTVQEMQE